MEPSEVTTPAFQTNYQINGTWSNSHVNQSGCHYHGNIRNVSDSWVAVSVCAGLTGAIFDGKKLRQIEPLVETGASFNAQHVVKTANQRETSLSCGVQSENKGAEESRNKIKRQAPWDRHKEQSRLYVELFLAIDNSLFRRLKSIEKTVAHATNVVNIVNMIYRPFDISVTLSGLEIWSERDLIFVNAELASLLDRFSQSHCSPLNKEKHDAAHLLTGETKRPGMGVEVGYATVGSICWISNACGVTMDLAGETDAFTASVLAHELGHNFGMGHDDAKCFCSDKSCVMAPSASNNPPSHRWSSCSQEMIRSRFNSFNCLKNKPNRCGNMVVDDGEDCDCGLPSNCRNPCCDPATCRFVKDAKCATGGCCNPKTCQLKSSGSECRPKTNECDLPEICSGADTECPVDLHIYDGTSCGAEKVNTRDVSTNFEVAKGRLQACANGICSRQLTRALRTCPVNCTDNGVCNNLGKCHCFSGLPPLCQYEAVTSRASLYYLFFLLLVPIIIGVLLFLWSKRRIEIEPQKPPPITVEKRFRNSIGEWAKKRSNLTLSIRPAPSIGNMALLSSGSTPNSARTPLSAATTITQVSPEDGITNPALELGEDRVTFGQRLAVPKVRFCVPSRPAPPPPSLDSRLQHSNGVECSPESPGVAKYQTASNGMANGSPLRPAWKKPNQLQENSPPPPPPPPPPAFMKPKL